MNIYKQYAPIYRNATVLLRPRTPLKDMYLALDPGHQQAGAVPNGGTLGVGQHAPDIDVDQILASLDADTRNYLLLLLSGGAQAFRDPGRPGRRRAPTAVADLRGTFKRFAPLDRDTQTFATLLAHAQREHPPRDPQPPAGGHVARRRRRAARVADQLVEHELRGDLLAGRQPRGGAVAAARARCRRPTRRSARCRAFAAQLGPALHAAACRSPARSRRR